MKKGNWISVLLIACSLYGAGIAFGNVGMYTFSGLCILAEAIFLAGWFFRRNRRILDMEALFSLFWLGGVGLSALKLSYLATEWTMDAWISFAGVHALFVLGYEGIDAWIRRKKAFVGTDNRIREMDASGVSRKTEGKAADALIQPAKASSDLGMHG